jgi:NAD(P)-dependent dehydrogenase (short-subunit alcohol dehydrogenase family)
VISHSSLGQKHTRALDFSLDKLYATIQQRKGSINILFANAGLGEPAPLPAISEAHFDRAFDFF